jgi:hypothetical protein
LNLAGDRGQHGERGALLRFIGEAQARGNGETLTHVSKSIGVGERDLYRAIVK